MILASFQFGSLENFDRAHFKSPTLSSRGNNVRDFEANLRKVIYNDVEVEPELQPILTEKLDGLTGDIARPNIRA